MNAWTAFLNFLSRRTTLYALAYAVLFATWVALVFAHTAGADQLVGYIKDALGGLTVHVFTVIYPAKAETTTPANPGQTPAQ